MAESIIQIVPGAPPAVNGVGDHALVVAKELRSTWGINTRFLVCNATWEEPTELDGFKLVPMRSRSSDKLYSALSGLAVSDPAAVLLQLSPYGFDRNGSPFWLLSGLARWKNEVSAGRKLFTYFHELYATGMFWRRAFWASPLQRICAREIARLSDVALTNTERYVECLEKWDPGKKGLIPRMPVVSNIGEPSQMPEFGQRSRRLVIWGSAAAKQEIYERHCKTVEGAVKTIGVEQIVDVGQVWHGCPARLGEVPIRIMGIMQADKLSNELANSVLAAFSYNPNYLGKSTMYAAFCAHAVPAICLPTRVVEQRTWDGIAHGVHFMTSVPSTEDGVMMKLTQISRMAHKWYFGHRISEHARAIARIILVGAKANHPGGQ